MPCMCGDTNCPSCGPAQGYDPALELVIDWLYEVVLEGVDDEDGVDRVELAALLAEKFGKYKFAEVLYSEAVDWKNSLRGVASK